MLARIKNIMLISTPNDFPNFERFLAEGLKFEVNFTYKSQTSLNGLAQKFIF